MTVLRWGLLGTARINRALTPPLKNSARNQLTAVASRDQARAEAYAREWQIPRAHGSYEALLADPEVDVIYLSLPNSLHTPWAVQALRAGKHVLCEKPMALSLAEMDTLQSAARQSGRILAEAFMYRHHPQTLRVRELVADGAIGELRLIQGSFSFSLAQAGDVRLNAGLGGGSIWDVGCYPVSYARWVAGQEPVEVFGQQVAGRGGVDEVFLGQLRFPGQVRAQFDSGFCVPFRARMEIVGSSGVIELANPFKPTPDQTFSLRRGDSVETITLPPAGLYEGEVEDLADAVLLGRPQRVSLEDSRGNAAALCALVESARTGRPAAVAA